MMTADSVEDRLILPLSGSEQDLQLVGGKGRALQQLIAAGMPVPAGFIVSTRAYQAFIVENDLQVAIEGLLQELPLHNAADLQQAATGLQQKMLAGDLPAGLVAQIHQARARLAESVAVRSSATAEDLPELSFAGQHDSYLNIRGNDAVLDAVRRCFASLWNPHAIAYRSRMQVEQQAVAMAVVIQEMLDADVSGVLFTANPMTGSRSELLVNAGYGLGDAIVSGQTTPDTWVIAYADLTPKQLIPGSKTWRSVASPTGGISLQPVPDEQRAKPALNPKQLAELAELGLNVQSLFDGEPQDIEWALSGDRCWLLQARPVTRLPDPPPPAVDWQPPDGAERLIRRQVVENMPEPLSPLFEELYLTQGLDLAVDELVRVLQMPFRIDEFIALPMFVTVNGYGYSRYDLQISWRTLRIVPGMLVWYVRCLPRLLKNLTSLWQDQGLPEYLAAIEKVRSGDLSTSSDAQLLADVRELACADARHWYYITMMVGAAKISESMLDWLLRTPGVKKKTGAVLTSGMFLSGFPSSTLTAQEDLDALARKISAVEPLVEQILAAPAQRIPALLAEYPTGAPLAEELADYLARYGHQIYNLDFVEPTQIEKPLAVLLALRSQLSTPKPAAGVDADSPRQAAAAKREALTAQTLAAVGPLRRWLLRKLLSWAQKFGPFREQALFYMGAGWPELRRRALELGRRLVARGRLEQPDDVFYLTSAELEQTWTATAPRPPDLVQLATQRRALRQQRMKLHPPGRVPEDVRFRFGPFDVTRFFAMWETQKRNSQQGNELTGFAVSPGRVSGNACVIRSAADFADMLPGSILVCPTTTPAWTPLFAQAAGLVTDIGGVLAHGSIVAREYGIPAVLGTGNITQRIRSGARITVDGNTGRVTLLDE